MDEKENKDLEIKEDKKPEGSAANENQKPESSSYEEANKSKGLAIASLVMGILSIISCGCCCPLGVVAIIFAIIVLVKHKGGKVMAIIGMILSAISILYVIISTLMFLPLKDSYMDFVTNMDEYLEEYEEEGIYPEFVDELYDRQPGNEENKEKSKQQLMEIFEMIYGKNIESEE